MNYAIDTRDFSINVPVVSLPLLPQCTCLTIVTNLTQMESHVTQTQTLNTEACCMEGASIAALPLKISLHNMQNSI